MRLQKLNFLFKSLLLVLIFFSVFYVLTPKAYAETHVSGALDGDQTWTLANSPYIVDGYTLITNGASLTIEPGVIIKFAPFAYITMEDFGSLHALGTVDNKIYFTSLEDDEIGGDTNGDGSASVPDISDNSPNIWYGLAVSDGFGNSVSHISLQNVIVRYADAGLLFCRIADVNIVDSVFENNREGIDDCGQSHVTLSNTKIINNHIGINISQENDLPQSSYTVNSLSIFGNSNYGVLNTTHFPPQVFNWGKSFQWIADLFKPNEVFAQEDPGPDYILDFRNTWWGDKSGPKNNDTNASGLGNKVSGLVSFSPWVTEDPDKPACCSNVLFLPGLEASRLYTPRADGSEDQLWEPNVNSDVEDLYLNTDGTSKKQNIYTRDIIKESNTPVSTGSLGQNIYKSFVNMLDDLVNNSKIADFKLFAYDWRQSVDDIVNNGTKYQDGNVSLVDTLQSLVKSSKNGKVTIVAHSNGGLLAKALLKKLQDDKIAGRNNLIDSVDTLIMVAVPEIGTASAVPAIMHGYDQSILGGLLMTESRARELGRNMLGAFGLLPSKAYINHVSASPATFVDTLIPSGVTTKLVQTFGSAISSYAEYKDFLFGAEGRTNPTIDQTNLPVSLSQSLFSKAESLHDSIDAFTPPSSMRVIEVAGWGLDTVASFEYYPQACTQSIGCGYTMDERPRFTSDGDGTVVVPSAQYMSLNGAEKYWVNLFQINNDKFPLSPNHEHDNILETQPVLGFISNAIQEITLPNSIYLSTTSPVDIKNRFRISIHSPVTLDAYDSNSNHTGKICPPNYDFCYAEENIPNSSYLEFGEGKYINLPEDQMSKVKLQGTDVGTFTYDSEKVLPDGTSTTSSFVDIPVTTQTQAEVTLNQLGAPQLALDVTGDGVTDFTLTPNEAFDPILFLQVMRKTVDSFDIAKQQKNTLLKRIDDTIKAIQKGKINKAKLKIEQFKKALIINPKESDKDRQEREKKNEREYEREHKEKQKPKQLSPADAQTLITLLNQLLDNLNN